MSYVGKIHELWIATPGWAPTGWRGVILQLWLVLQNVNSSLPWPIPWRRAERMTVHHGTFSTPIWRSAWPWAFVGVREQWTFQSSFEESDWVCSFSVLLLDWITKLGSTKCVGVRLTKSSSARPSLSPIQITDNDSSFTSFVVHFGVASAVKKPRLIIIIGTYRALFGKRFKLQLKEKHSRSARIRDP